MYLHIKPSTKSFMFQPVIKVQYVKYSPRVFYRQMMISLPSLCHSTPPHCNPDLAYVSSVDQHRPAASESHPSKANPPVW